MVLASGGLAFDSDFDEIGVFVQKAEELAGKGHLGKFLSKCDLTVNYFFYRLQYGMVCDNQVEVYNFISCQICAQYFE